MGAHPLNPVVDHQDHYVPNYSNQFQIYPNYPNSNWGPGQSLIFWANPFEHCHCRSYTVTIFVTSSELVVEATA